MTHRSDSFPLGVDSVLQGGVSGQGADGSPRGYPGCHNSRQSRACHSGRQTKHETQLQQLHALLKTDI